MIVKLRQFGSIPTILTDDLRREGNRDQRDVRMHANRGEPNEDAVSIYLVMRKG